MPGESTLQVITAPTAGGWLVDLWKPVARCVDFCNAWLGGSARIIASDREAITITKGNVVIEYVAGSGAVVAARYAWQPYLSPWKGTSSDPLGDNRAKAFRLRRGKIARRTPVNMSQQFLAFGDITNKNIEEQDAVITQVYAQVPITETTPGYGILQVDRATIKIVQGEDLKEALGSAIPVWPEDGTLPSYAIVPICEVFNWGGQLHFDDPGLSYYLELGVVVSGYTDDGTVIRDFAWTRANPDF